MGEGAGTSWGGRIPIWTWLRRLGGIFFILQNFRFTCLTRGGPRKDGDCD